MKKIIVIILVTVLSLLTAGGVCSVFAEETVPPEQVTEGDGSGAQEPVQEPEKTDIEQLAESFLAYLKEKYGEDYEYYHAQIIEQWGSVEAYLLSLGENLPEDYQNGWEKFVGWLGEYAAVWAPAFAVLLVIVAAVFGKKVVNKIAELFKKLFKGSNQQSSALIAVIHAQKALMGTNEKFSETVKELEDAEKGLEK